MNSNPSRPHNMDDIMKEVFGKRKQKKESKEDKLKIHFRKVMVTI